MLKLIIWLSNEIRTQTVSVEGRMSEHNNDIQGVFISYKSENRECVDKIYEDLRIRGVKNLWMDKKKLKGGDKWLDEIENAIDASSHMVACYTKLVDNSEPIRQEYSRMRELGRPIIPVIIDETGKGNLPEILKDVEAFSIADEGYDRVIERLVTECKLPKIDHQLPKAFCHIPADKFIIGNPLDSIQSQIEDDFWIAQTPVTNNEYLCFVRADESGINENKYWLRDTKELWSVTGRAGRIRSEEFIKKATKYTTNPVTDIQ
mgnify:CR=1 FL=1